jgi:hypothetical protein
VASHFNNSPKLKQFQLDVPAGRVASRCAADAGLLAPEPIPLFLFSEARENFGEPLASALAGDGLDEAERRPFSRCRHAATLILSAIRLSIFRRRSSDGIL